MAKFCTKCGKKLEEGKKCNCEKVNAEKAETNKEVTKNLSQINAKDTAGTVVEVAKGIFTKPVNTIKKLANPKNFNLGLIILAAAIIAQALFMSMSLRETFDIDTDSLEGSMTSMILIGSLAEANGVIGDFFEDIVEIDDDGDISFNFGKAFISSIIIAVVIYGSLLLSIYLVLKFLMKKNIDFKKIITTISIASSINIVLWLSALVLLFIIPSIITIVVVSLGLYFIFTLYQALTITEELDANKFPLMYSIAYAGVLVILYVLLQIL